MPRSLVAIARRLAVTWLIAVATIVPAHAQQDDPAADRGSRKGYSPLHDFLGIDPQTGTFVEPQARQRDTNARRADAGAGDKRPARARASEGDAGGALTGADRPPMENWPRDADEAAEAMRQVTDQLRDGSLGELPFLIDQRGSGDRWARLARQFAWLTAALLMLYPLGIVIAEVFDWAFHRHESGLTDGDHRYRRVRLLRRVLWASAWVGLIVIGTWGSLNGYWWGQPTRFTLFCTAIAVLGLATASLSSLINQAARQYPLTLMRELRREQQEMRHELTELRKRLRQVTMTSD